ncbi:MAG: hypothetical protein J0M37_12590 [Ignavibacteria bacterium]|nr:hypothetical protein [Ignavibacteria bacterium]
MNKIININAPIIPNESLGGIKLRENKNSLIGQLKQNKISYEVSYENEDNKRVSLFSILEEIIIVSVDNKNSKIFRVTANAGYIACLFDKIKIGYTLQDVINTGEGFYYDEREDTILSSKHHGVSLDLDVPDYLATDVINPKIGSISVFAEDSMSLEGQRGKW